ncbi:MAG: 50S ribosomal protein L15 [Deltaproteobacteria bacterium]|nr:50S ribosomal protein L15 [Deltaproteobacteria bacterium]
MDLNSLRPVEGATKKRKRIGRGPGSGHGKTATKGHKGQKARSGGSVKAGFEGGQMPMQRRLPKRGFNPLKKKVFALVKLSQLDTYAAGTTVTVDELRNSGFISKVHDGIKVLADGALTKPLTVIAHKFTAAAKEKIIAAGGTVQELTI